MMMMMKQLLLVSVFPRQRKVHIAFRPHRTGVTLLGNICIRGYIDLLQSSGKLRRQN